MSSDDDDLGFTASHVHRGVVQMGGGAICSLSLSLGTGATSVLVAATGVLLAWVPLFLPNPATDRVVKAMAYFWAGGTALVFARVLFRALDMA